MATGDGNSGSLEVFIESPTKILTLICLLGLGMAYRILILLLASKVHEVEKLKWKIKRLKEIVDKMEIETVNILIEGPYSSINNALEKLKENSSIGGIIIYCLTGGTSKIAYEISGKCNAPLWLMADESDNSLPSTINLREKVRRIGRIAKIIYLNEPIERIYRKLETFNRVVNIFDLFRKHYFTEIRYISIQKINGFNTLRLVNENE